MSGRRALLRTGILAVGTAALGQTAMSQTVAPRTDADAVPLAPVWHVMGYGQSLSLGVLGVPALTTEPRGDSLMFADGIRRPMAGGRRPGSFAPLRETDDRNRGETGIAAAAEMFRQTLAALRGAAPSGSGARLLGSSAGRAGARLARLMPATSNYRRLLQDVAAAQALAQAEGRAYRYLATLWSHGEADQWAAMPRASYAAGVAELARGLAADIARISGQDWVPPFLTGQPASHLSYFGRRRSETSWRPDIALALRDAAQADPAIICVLPLYIGAFRDGVHGTSTTYRMIGRYYGRALAKLVHARESGTDIPPLALDLVAATWRRDAVELRFAVPSGPLAFDTQAVAAAPKMGFDLWDPSGALLADVIAGLRIVAPDRVVLSLTHEPVSGSRLSYAFGRPGDIPTAGRHEGPRGNLRDSEGSRQAGVLVQDDDGTGTAWHLDNWALIFETVKP